MEFPSQITIRDKYEPAMDIKDEAEAREYFERCVRHSMSHGRTREEAESVERRNLGYYAGYYDDATAQRVLRLFGAAHPIFGASRPSTEEALGAGAELALPKGPPAAS